MRIIEIIKGVFEEIISDWNAYDTGPFCRHWSDPAECDEVCGTCGHECHQHGIDEDDSGCMAKGCGCKEWKEG